MHVGIFFIDFRKIIKNNYYICKSRKKIHINNKEGQRCPTKKTKKIIRYGYNGNVYGKDARKQKQRKRKNNCN